MNEALIPALLRAEKEYQNLLADLSRAMRARALPAALCGLCDGAADALLAALLADTADARPGAALLLLPEEKDCARLAEYLGQYGLRAAFFTGRDLTFYNITASHEFEHARLGILFGLSHGDLDVVLTTPDAALGYTLSPEELKTHTILLDTAKETAPAALAAQLVAAGYTHADPVEGPGQFTVRGGIVDVFAPHLHALAPDGALIAEAGALRIEFFGDEIDRMGLFDPETQRVHTMLAACEIPPAREVLLTEETRAVLRGAVEGLLKKTKDARAADELRAELAALDAGGEIRFADKYLALALPARACLLSYFADHALTVLRGTNAIFSRLTAALWHMHEAAEELLSAGTLPPDCAEYMHTERALAAFLERATPLHLDSIAEGLSGKRLSGLYHIRSKQTVSYHDRTDLLTEDLADYRAGHYTVVVAAPSETAAKNICGYLTAHGFAARLADGTPPDETTVLVEWQEPSMGFELPASRTAVLSLAEDTRRGGLSLSRTRPAREKRAKERTILSYADLQPGDLVVHEAHGIGRYLGLETLTIDGVTRDYVSIQYAGTDQLYLPCDRLDAISKYIGAHADDGLVKLSRFGGGDWKKAKARASAAVKDMAKDLIRLYAERERRPGFAFPPDDDYQRDFEIAFEYEETEAQRTAAAEIKADMIASRPMDRLLCGDVGFGKTEVALRAAYKAVLAGKQVAVLVPTTILALQHFATVSARMRPFAVRVDMISRFRTARQQQASLRALARGDTDVIIGTHRLISGDVKFKDLGLLIVDEEQRFGVAQKEKIKALAGNVDVLTLTATPIPRTLNMAMSGIRDISLLDEAPGDRLPVQTYVLEDDPLIIEDAIRRELRRGGQVFYLHNEVGNIHTVAAAISRAVPEARVTVAHGQMDREELERIWGEMLEGRIDVLVSTTIIETGVDVPNANTLIVDGAHRLGLSQLHQLRGRVGRSPRRAYAYFTYPRGRALNDLQRKRLEAIREYAEFGAGFRIALRDLELRGAGNLLGAEQHGHLDAIGYDLYVKLLNEAVLAERGEAVPERAECVVSLSFDACLPAKYVPAPAQRIALYKRIALIETPADLDDMADELSDRYGELPRPAQNLLQIALIRSMAQRCGVTQLKQEGTAVDIHAPALDVDAWMALSEQFGGKLRILLSANPFIRFRAARADSVLSELRALFAAYPRQEKTNIPQNGVGKDEK